MASLDLDEIDDFLSSLDPENYSLRHAFMPMDQDEVKFSSNATTTNENEIKSETSETAKRDRRQSNRNKNELELKDQREEIMAPDRSPESSGTDENSPPSGRPIREQDRFLPLAIVSRLMKECLPTSAKVSRGARHLLQECVSEFIAFVTSEAIERCLADRRKTLTGEDLMAAMRTLGFDNYMQPMTLYLEKIQAQIRGDHVDSLTQPTERPKIVKVEGNVPLLQFAQSLNGTPSESKKHVKDVKKWV